MRRRFPPARGPLRPPSLLAVLTAMLLALTPALQLPHGFGGSAAAQPFQQNEAGLIDDTSYESPQYGYTVTWESPWEVDDATTSRRAGDVLALAGDDATLRFTGQAAEGEPAELLETTIDTLQDEQPQVELVSDDPEADVPFAVLEGNTDRVFFEVRTVAGGDALVLVELQAPADAFADAVADAEAVLLDDEAILTSAIDAETGEEATETETDTDDSDAPSLDIADPTEEASTETETETDTEGGDGLTLDETPASGADDEESAVDGNTYTSPVYDYTFEWDEDVWQVSQDGEQREPGYEALQLESDTGLLIIQGIEGANGDPEICLESEAEANQEFEDIEDWEPAVNADGEEVTGSDETSAYGVFTFVLTDPEDETAEPLDLVAYIECRTLVEGEAVLDILAISPREAYDDHIENVLAVTETIEIPGAETDTETETELDISTDTETATETETDTETATETETDTGTETETDTETSATGVDGTSFTSPTYGFSLSWPDTWEVTDETIDADEGRETLVLDNGVSTVTIEALPFTGDLPACVDAAIDEDGENPDYEGLELATTGEGEPFQGSDDETAYAVYLYAGEGGDEFAHFVECRWIVEGESVLVFTQDVPNDQWVDQRQERRDIQESITLAEE